MAGKQGGSAVTIHITWAGLFETIGIGVVAVGALYLIAGLIFYFFGGW